MKWLAINIKVILSSAAISCVLITCLLQGPHIWYQSTFLGTSGNFFILFFSKKKGQNWAVNFTSIFETFYADSRKPSCITEFLFQKYAVSKKNHLIWSYKSGDIADLKSAIFQNVGDGRRN